MREPCATAYSPRSTLSVFPPYTGRARRSTMRRRSADAGSHQRRLDAVQWTSMGDFQMPVD
jgi:hypothetical protein